VPAAVFAGLLIATVRLNAASRRLAAFWGAWGLLTLAPTANLLDQEAKFAKRNVLLALVSTAALAALWMSSLQRKRPARFAGAFAILAVALCAAVSWQRCEHFEDEITFHSQWASTNPLSLDAHVNLGLALHNAGRIDEAIEHHQAALKIDPDYAGAHINLGNSLLAIGKPQDALRHYQQVLNNPRYPEHRADMHFNMALVFERTDDFAAALTSYQALLAAEPNNIDAHISLGNIHFRLMEYELSSQHFRNALELVAKESSMGQQLRDSIRQAEARIQER
jgi:tetratricopeptide (TPR) repeat protein